MIPDELGDILEQAAAGIEGDEVPAGEEPVSEPAEIDADRVELITPFETQITDALTEFKQGTVEVESLADTLRRIADEIQETDTESLEQIVGKEIEDEEVML